MGLNQGSRKQNGSSQVQAEATGITDQIAVGSEGETKGKSDSKVSNSNRMARDTINEWREDKKEAGLKPKE